MEQDERKEPSADETQSTTASTEATGSGEHQPASDQGDGATQEPKAEEEPTGAPV